MILRKREKKTEKLAINTIIIVIIKNCEQYKIKSRRERENTMVKLF